MQLRIETLLRLTTISSFRVKFQQAGIGVLTVFEYRK